MRADRARGVAAAAAAAGDGRRATRRFPGQRTAGAPPPRPRSTRPSLRRRAGGRGRRGRRRVAGQRVWLRPRRPARALRRRRLHLLGAGQALRARVRGPDRRPQARAATLRAFRLAHPDRDDQRPPRSRARRQRPLRRSAGGVPDRAPQARLRGPDAQGDRVADAVWQGFTGDDRGRPRSGKTEALRRLVPAMGGAGGPVGVRRAGRVRPEEISEWNGGPSPVAAVTFAASDDARNGAVEPAIDQARRLAARGADAVVLIDTLDGCSPRARSQGDGAARNIVDGGSVTMIATARRRLAARRRSSRSTRPWLRSALPGARSHRQRDDAARVAGRRGRRRGDRQDPRRGRRPRRGRGG